MIQFNVNHIDLFIFDVVIIDKYPFSMTFIHVDHKYAVNMNDIVICRYEYTPTFGKKILDMNAPHRFTGQGSGPVRGTQIFVKYSEIKPENKNIFPNI